MGVGRPVRRLLPKSRGQKMVLGLVVAMEMEISIWMQEVFRK